MSNTRAPPEGDLLRSTHWHTVESSHQIDQIERDIKSIRSDISDIKTNMHLSPDAIEQILQTWLNEKMNSILSEKTPVSLSHETPKRSLERESLQLQSPVAWLRANDPDLQLSIRQAEKQSGISRATINRAQSWIRNEWAI